jgi:hypothetical protein
VHHPHLTSDEALDGVDLALLDAHDLVDDAALDLHLGLDEGADVEPAALSPFPSVGRLGSTVAGGRSAVRRGAASSLLPFLSAPAEGGLRVGDDRGRDGEHEGDGVQSHCMAVLREKNRF